MTGKFNPSRWVAALAYFFFLWAVVSPERLFFPEFGNSTSDSASYVAWSMTLAIDADLDFSNEVADRLIAYPNGQIRPVHPAGPGIMAAPVVAVASLADRLTGHPVIEDRAQFGGSWSYFGFFLSTIGALLAGMYFATVSLQVLAPELPRAVSMLAIAGSGLPYYALKQFTMGHSFEFLSAAMILWGVTRDEVGDRIRSLSALMVALGIFFGLLVRPANLNVLLLPLLVRLALTLARPTTDFGGSRIGFARWVHPGVPLGAVSALAANTALFGTVYPSFRLQYLAPTVLRSEMTEGVSTTATQTTFSLWASATEFVSDTTARAMGVFARASPSDLLTIVFTQEYGLLWFMPIVPLGGLALVAGLGVLWRRGSHRRFLGVMLAASVLYAALPLGVVLVWQSHASSFGFRYLFSLVPLGLLGIGLWWTLEIRWRKISQRVALAALAGLSFFSLLGQAFQDATPELSLTRTMNSFGRLAGSNPTFAADLLAAMQDPSAWLNMLARGFLGFVGLALVPNDALIAFAEGAGVVPRHRADTVTELVGQYQILIQGTGLGLRVAFLLLIGVIVPAALMWISNSARGQRGR